MGRDTAGVEKEFHFVGQGKGSLPFLTLLL